MRQRVMRESARRAEAAALAAWAEAAAKAATIEARRKLLRDPPKVAKWPGRW